MKAKVYVNLKNYKAGKEVIKIVKVIAKYSDVVCVSPTDIYESVGAVKGMTDIYSQHVDFQDSKRATGFVLADAIKEDGAKGSLVNHSEHRLERREIKKTLKRCKEKGLKVVLCVANVKEAKKYLKLRPDAIAFEVPELISSGKSISMYRADSLKEFSEVVDRFNKRKREKVLKLCGAGISCREDVDAAMSLGCDGVLLASAVTKSKSPGKFVRGLKG